MTNEKSLIYKKAYVELYEIIKRLTEKEKECLPRDFIKNLERDMDGEYEFKYDESKNIVEQNLLNETKALLVQMYIKYLASENEKELWGKYNKICLENIEKERRIKYNPNNLFENKKLVQNNVEKISNQEVAIVEYKESIFKKIWNRILSIFKK